MRCLLHRLDHRDERGATLVVVALSMVALFGMVVLSVDLGGLLVKRRSVVNANDSAALAAAVSFARGEAQVDANEGPAITNADAFATDNVSNAARDDFEATGGLPGSSCDPATCGSVEVQYHGNQALFFAPVIGLGSNVGVKGTATAIWGPAGSGNPEPIMVRIDWLNTCGVPNPHPPTPCNFWLNDHDDNGNPLWSWINLTACPDQQCGWDTGQASYNCPNVGASDRDRWIRGDVGYLPVNPVPTPTYVCTVSGHASANFAALAEQVGKFKIFPVNDATGLRAPPGQVDRSGSPCPPPSCSPNEYDIVGFTILRIDNVLHGDDPAAIGDPGGPGSCSASHDFNKNPPGNTWDLDNQGCTITALHYPGDLTRLYPRLKKGNTTYAGNLTGQCAGLDYCYDPANHVITWQRNQNVSNVNVAWDFVQPPTPGLCGTHRSDPNAVCLVTSWQGFQSGGHNPGGGEDFGLRAVRLSD